MFVSPDDLPPPADLVCTTSERQTFLQGRKFAEYESVVYDAVGREVYRTPTASHHLNPIAAAGAALRALDGGTPAAPPPNKKVNSPRRAK